MGRQGQVAIFVLVGLILVIGIILALYVINQKKIETTTTEDEQLRLQQNPELAAERARMQQRVDECLAGISEAAVEEALSSGTPFSSLTEVEAYLSEEIGGGFHVCFYQYNTAEKLSITDEALPRVSVVISDDRVLITTKYAVRGELDDETYTLTTYTATLEESPRAALEMAMALRAAYTPAGAPGATTTIPETGGPGLPDIDVNALFDEHCYYDAYAFEAQGIYTDLLLLPEGERRVYVYDYTTLDATRAPRATFVDLPPCTPAPETGSPKLLSSRQETVTCSVGAPCDLREAFDRSALGIEVSFLSSLIVDEYLVETTGVEPGAYTVLAIGGDAATPILQHVTVVIS